MRLVKSCVWPFFFGMETMELSLMTVGQVTKLLYVDLRSTDLSVFLLRMGSRPGPQFRTLMADREVYYHERHR